MEGAVRLKTLKLTNFRAYKTETVVNFDDITAFIGKNDVGKSTVFEALEIFFEQAKMDQLDCCVSSDSEEVRICCVFDRLPEQLVLDSSATTTLKTEYLLNADGDLEILKVFDCSKTKPSDEIYAVALHPTKSGVSQLHESTQKNLKKQAKELNCPVDDLRSNVALRRAIWAASGDLALENTNVPLKKADGKEVWAQIQKYLPQFALFRADRPSTDTDAECQDPMKIAVNNALEEVRDELQQIKDQVQARVVEVANRTLGKLREFDKDLANDLKPEFNSEPKWNGLFKLTLNDHNDIPINKRGSGVRRLILLSFFRAEVERKRAEESIDNVIYAIEEPETAQHPDNQRMLIEALLELSEDNGCQVVLTTHVPGLAELLPTQSIRYITKVEDGRHIATASDETLKDVARALGVYPDQGVKVIVCLEGPRDIECLTHFAHILRDEDPSLPDLESDSAIILLHLGGSTLKNWVNHDYLYKLGIPEVHIYDRDDKEKPKYQDTADKVNQRGNGSKAFITSKREMENFLHPEPIKDVFEIEIDVTDECDVPQLIAQKVHENAGSGKPWKDVPDKKRKDKESAVKKRLNRDVAEKMTIMHFKERNAKDEVLSWLRAIGECVVAVEPIPIPLIEEAELGREPSSVE
ncbi:hypothetical protein DV096_15435 [Bradymonadaceae bacterium TMQ3]|nr:hypothetical protein DV096_15435 [Bradymonadaceae bacterium TMQ3]TXC74698.1 ATP-binding protein [Bradymonadales bacterium TMQ1]